MPLILSTRALDITKEGSTSLISTHIHDRDAWYGMLDYAVGFCSCNGHRRLCILHVRD